jgi:hypothetical protein
MSGYPLEAAMALKRRQEQAALKRLEDARRVRATAEARADALREASESARVTLGDARAREAPTPGVTASAVDEAARERFVARLRETYRRASAAYAEYEAGPLRKARQADDAARQAHGEARRACEALNLHEEKFRHEERRARDRREEDQAEEAARAARHRSR